ncbi:hypothetical protein R3P38DRAFT_3465773 [Favolaschia claudopus]|uniref:Uncharacterized protein n=1 Tax=Favolaschia claudopus TaxID=2862362 RepID=A0AAV9ZEU4_9AGAR
MRLKTAPCSPPPSGRLINYDPHGTDLTRAIIAPSHSTANGTSTPLRVYKALALTPNLQLLHIHRPLPLPLQSTDTFAPTHSSPSTAPAADIISALAYTSTLAHLSILFSSPVSRPTFTAVPQRRQGATASNSFRLILILHLPPCPGPRVPHRPPLLLLAIILLLIHHTTVTARKEPPRPSRYAEKEDHHMETKTTKRPRVRMFFFRPCLRRRLVLPIVSSSPALVYTLGVILRARQVQLSKRPIHPPPPALPPRFPVIRIRIRMHSQFPIHALRILHHLHSTTFNLPRPRPTSHPSLVRRPPSKRIRLLIPLV